MKLGKLDLDDALKHWAAPARDDRAWDERADAIVGAATAGSSKGDDGALMTAPILAAEPGEPMGLGGDGKMSDEQKGDGGSQSSGSSKKRQSLKEMRA